MAARAATRAAAARASEPAAEDPHAGHHGHLAGTAVYCSCGQLLGVTCVAFDGDYVPDRERCHVCGQAGVLASPVTRS